MLSLFDGISCARVALDRLGYTDILYLASEVDKYAIQIAQKNFPNTIQLGDVYNIRREDLPVHIDLLIGGSPCQDLSIAKKNRQGLDGERSSLFWEWVRLWRECQPKYWVLENVNSMPKAAKQVISETLDVEPIMINAALVSAQNRKRLFWTNIQTDMFGYCHIPQPEDKGILLKHILETGSGIADKSHPINATYWKAGTSAAGQDYSNRTHRRTLIAESVENGDKSYAIPEATKKGYAIAEEGDSVDLSYPNSKTRRGRVSKKASSQSVGVLEGHTIRKLTPVECERLQSLPDNYTDGINNTQRYKCLGNAFNVEVVRHILSFMEL